MRKLILEMQVSIDGYLADKNGKTNWMLWNWGPEWTWDKALQQYHTSLTIAADCILLSRQMAEEGFIAHWQKTAEITGNPQAAFAKHVNNTHKIVFTKTLNKSVPIPGGWDNVDIAGEDFVSEINQLKKQAGKNIIAYGGASFAGSLLRENLIDELHLLVNPVALGSGLSIFHYLRDKQDLGLAEARSFDCGMALLHYIVGNNGQLHDH